MSNAVAHRRYDISGRRTVVEVRPDRLVIASPGGLVEGVRLERLRTAQAARNDSVIGALRALRVAEDSGRGIDLMEDEMTAALLQRPTFEADGDSFRVTLSLRALVSREERAWVLRLERLGLIERLDTTIVVAVARHGAITNAVVRERTGLDSTQARGALRRLVVNDVLVREGERGGARYSLAPGLGQPLAPTLDQARARAAIVREATSSPLSNADVRRLLGVDAETARALLKQLVEEGALRAEGQTRGRRYTTAGRTRDDGQPVDLDE